jgi:glycosyltransferase involved in cell wall biosynthesis
MSNPKITIVLPTHNRPVLLSEALASIGAQTYQNWEAIIVDDASTPPANLSEAIAHYGPHRIRVTRHETGMGGAASKTTGIALAQGDIVAFLDDDDLYEPHFLGRVVEIFDRWDDLEVLFVGVGWFGSLADISQKMHDESTAYVLQQAQPDRLGDGLWRFGPQLLSPLLQKVPMPFQRPVVKKSALQRIGGYRRECLLWDCDWALRASMLAQCAFLAERLYLQRFEQQGYFSHNNQKLAQFESALEITLGLYTNPPIPLSLHQQNLLRRAVSQSALDLAGLLAHKKLVRAALHAWWMGQSTEPLLRNYKRLLAIIAYFAGLRRPPE